MQRNNTTLGSINGNFSRLEEERAQPVCVSMKFRKTER